MRRILFGKQRKPSAARSKNKPLPPAGVAVRTGYATGLRAEKIALWYLRCKGYRRCAQRFKTRYGEIDLVMRRGRVLVFVEVKARPALDVGLEAISQQSRERIRNAALVFLRMNPRYANYVWRFDAVVVRPRRLPYHLESAW